MLRYDNARNAYQRYSSVRGFKPECESVRLKISRDDLCTSRLLIDRLCLVVSRYLLSCACLPLLSARVSIYRLQEAPFASADPLDAVIPRRIDKLSESFRSSEGCEGPNFRDTHGSADAGFQELLFVLLFLPRNIANVIFLIRDRPPRARISEWIRGCIIAIPRSRA